MDRVGEEKTIGVVPVSFWYFSMSPGGALLLAYALYQRDPVFIVGQGLGVFTFTSATSISSTRKPKNTAVLG